jgi:hypothetical protein
VTTLTPEQRQAARQAGEQPIRLVDPDTDTPYVLLRADVYERLRPPAEGDPAPPEPEPPIVIPPGIQRSKAAFLRDLPELMAKRRYDHRWVAYHGDERIGIARDKVKLIRECLRRGLKRDEYYVGIIREHFPEPEEIDPSLYEFEDIEPGAQP